MPTGPIDNENVVNKSAPSKESAHPTHFGTVHEDPITGLTTHGITKENKGDREQASKLEAGFSALANLVMLSKHNTKMSLIRNKHDNSVYGVFSEHAAYILIREQEKQEAEIAHFLKIQQELFVRSDHELDETQALEIQNLEQKIRGSWVETLGEEAAAKMDLSESEDILALKRVHGEARLRRLQDRQAVQELENETRHAEKTVILQVPNFPVVNDAIAQITDKTEALFFDQVAHPRAIAPPVMPAQAVYEKPDTVWQEAMAKKYNKNVAEVSRLLLVFDSTASKSPEILEKMMSDLNPIKEAFKKELMERALVVHKCKGQEETNKRTEALVKQYDVKQNGFNFLHNTPPNFFARLMKAKEKGFVEIDMESLADVMGTAYGLEEDDLHKGNIGFYVTKTGDAPPRYHFFKIDHDLMFNAKIMATKDQRPSNITYTTETFKISAQNLLNFPDVTSGPHYWPTKDPLITKGRKAHNNAESRNAFKQLQFEPKFNEAKWRCFFKQAILPIGLVSKSLDQTYGNDVEVTAERTETLRATAEKFAEMRMAFLEIFAIPKFPNQSKEQREILQKKAFEFREDFITKKHEFKKRVLKEIEVQAMESGFVNPQELAIYMREAADKFTQMEDIALQLSHGETYSLLHMAIATDSYKPPFLARDWDKDSLKSKDKQDLTPLDYAIKQYEHHAALPAHSREREHYHNIIKDLMANGAESTQEHLSSRFLYVPKLTSLKQFYEKLEHLTSSTEDIVIIQREALTYLKEAQLTPPELKVIRDQLKKPVPEEPYTFIKRLHSNTYLGKKLHGEYGETDASKEMLKHVEDKIKKLESSVSGSHFSKFSSTSPPPSPSSKDAGVTPPTPSSLGGKGDGH